MYNVAIEKMSSHILVFLENDLTTIHLRNLLSHLKVLNQNELFLVFLVTKKLG